MWRKATLAFPGQFPALSCSIVAAHPWVFGLGQQTENGAYLSPANAVSWLAEKLSGVTGETEVVIMMATGATHDEFMASLDPLTAVFPAPAFTQVSRLARSAAELATVKMQKPSRTINGLPAALPLSVPTARTISSAGAIAQAGAAGGLNMTALKAALTGFSARRAGMLADIATGAGGVAGKSARAWVFTARGNAAEIVRQLADGIPALSSVYTAALMLAGADLSSIRKMIHDDDNHTGA